MADTTSLTIGDIQTQVTVTYETSTLEITSESNSVNLVCENNSLNLTNEVLTLEVVTTNIELLEIAGVSQSYVDAKIDALTIEDLDVPNGKELDVRPNGDMYLGKALPGKLTSDAAWSINKLVFQSDGDFTGTWANVIANVASTTEIWDNRLSLTYT